MTSTEIGKKTFTPTMSKRMVKAVRYPDYWKILGAKMPYDGNIPLLQYNFAPYTITRLTSLVFERTGLSGLFKILRENVELNRFTPQSIGPIIDYFEENKHNPEIISGLDPKKPVYVKGWVAADVAESAPGIYHAFEQLRPLTQQQEEIFERFMSSLALGHCADMPRKEVATGSIPDLNISRNEKTIAPIMVVPLVWAMELCSRSFNSTDTPADEGLYPLNQHEELVLMDFAWCTKFIDKMYRMPGSGPGLRPDLAKPIAARVGMLAFGSLFSRLGFKEHLGDRKFWDAYPEKLRRVGMYASVAKELFMLKEKHLASEYLDPEKMVCYHAHTVDLQSIERYPDFLNTVANPTVAEQELAKKIGEIKNWLLWLDKESDKLDKVNKIGMDKRAPVHNALSFETDYDSRFTIPAEGQNRFVSKILNDTIHQIRRYFPRGKVIPKTFLGFDRTEFEGYRHLSDREKTISR